MITYGGIPLGGSTSHSSQLNALLAEWWHQQGIREFSHPGYHTYGIDHLPIPAPPQPECPRPWVLSWPTGASRWATFHAIVTGDQLTSIIGGQGSPRTLQVSDGTRWAEPAMWLLPPRPIGQVEDADYYLICLVDDRYWWWQQCGLPASNPASWTALLADLFTSVGVSASLPTIPAAYGTPDPVRWAVGFKPLPLLIDAACTTVGLRVIRELNGQVTVTTAATAQSADQSQWDLMKEDCLTGGRATKIMIGQSVPASVRVVFTGPVSQGAGIEDRTLASLGLATFAGITPVPGKVATVNADMSADDLAGYMAYATQAATDYYQWCLSLTDATFRGIVPWRPTGLEDRIEWDHSDKIFTRVFRTVTADRNTYGDSRPIGDAIVAEITARPAGGNVNYSAKRMTVNPGTGAVIDYVPTTTFNNMVVSPDSTSGAFDVGDRGYLYPVIDRPGRFWFLPIRRRAVWATYGTPACTDRADNTGATTYPTSDIQFSDSPYIAGTSILMVPIRYSALGSPFHWIGLPLGPATSTTPGYVSTNDQTWSGNKTIIGDLSAVNLRGTNSYISNLSFIGAISFGVPGTGTGGGTLPETGAAVALDANGALVAKGEIRAQTGEYGSQFISLDPTCGKTLPKLGYAAITASVGPLNAVGGGLDIPQGMWVYGDMGVGTLGAWMAVSGRQGNTNYPLGPAWVVASVSGVVSPPASPPPAGGFAIVSAGQPPGFAIRGAWGTDALGNIFKGGICTTVGSGSLDFGAL